MKISKVKTCETRNVSETSGLQVRFDPKIGHFIGPNSEILGKIGKIS